MNNLFKAILLCAILSNTFTPCFSVEASVPSTAAEAISHLPLAVPEDIVSNDENSDSNVDEDSQLNDLQENLPKAQSNSAFPPVKPQESSESEEEAVAACPVMSVVSTEGAVETFKKTYKCLADKELTAIKLEKGRKFEVKSLQPMSYESATGTEVMFETIYPERVFLSKDPSKLIFKGEVVKNKPPGKGGSSGTLKVQIKGITLETVTYPAEAYISKMNKKGVFFGAIAGPSNYKDNLNDVANNGTINNYYNMNPCDKLTDECVHAAAKPFYFLSGALLQTADLFIAPVIAFFAPGNEVFIPEGTEFEIKLEDDVPILEL